jgi:hypothetical protein
VVLSDLRDEGTLQEFLKETAKPFREVSGNTLYEQYSSC